MIVKLWKKSVLFYLGGCAYMGLEVLWRGFSHGTMFLAGGLCFLLLGELREWKLPLPLRMLAGSMMITAVELAAGLMWNRGFQVWDYRDQPGNFLGQICPVFSLLWMPVALAGMVVYDVLDKKIPG